MPAHAAFTLPAKVKTSTRVIHPIISALIAAESELGEDRKWSPTNDRQREFIRIFEENRAQTARIPEIESLSSSSHQLINEFLRERGFSIALSPFAPGDFGVASVLKLALEWLERGVEVPIFDPQGRRYPGVKIKGEGVEFFANPEHDHPIVVLKTKTGDEVLLTVAGSPVPIPAAALADFAKAITGHLGHHPERIEEVRFPMIDLDQQVDVSWLVDMSTLDESKMPWRIDQALQQTKFRMNEVGAKVESAMAVGMRYTSFRPIMPYVIDQPFVAIVRRPSLKEPIFVGYIDKDVWKKPAIL